MGAFEIPKVKKSPFFGCEKMVSQFPSVGDSGSWGHQSESMPKTTKNVPTCPIFDVAGSCPRKTMVRKHQSATDGGDRGIYINIGEFAA